jgi:hypothetical protein
MATAALYTAIKTALNSELATLYPAATYPVDNAEYAAMIEEYAGARQAAAKLSERAQDNYSAVGVSFGFRDAGGAARTASALAVRLARAGFSINAGTPVVHDLTEIHEPTHGGE